MSNGNAFERFSRLVFKIGMMIMDGKRKAEEVADWLQVVINNPDFIKILKEVPQSVQPSIMVRNVRSVHNWDWRAEWEKFYREFFGLTVDFSQIALADDPGGFPWVVFAVGELTLNQVLAKCRECFITKSDYLDDDLDFEIPTNERGVGTTYSRRFRDSLMDEPLNKGMTISQLDHRGGEYATLKEVLLLVLWFHFRTAGYLENGIYTICAGSRDRSGLAPEVYWARGWLRIDRFIWGVIRDPHRVRSAV